MPCYSWGIPASHCVTGSRLSTARNSVCADCYAQKGAYTWSNVSDAYERRLRRFGDDRWEQNMELLVDWQAQKTGEPFFRWFDSGDLQTESMLEKIARVARDTPAILHWLPTREYRIVDSYRGANELPANLTIRLSAHFVDSGPPSAYGLPTSTVRGAGNALGYPCPARDQRPANCHSCRACWDPSVNNVSYDLH